MPLVNTLKYLRLKHKLSRAFVSIEANVCVRTIDYYERGAVSITYECARNISKLFDYPIQEIIGVNRKMFITDEEFEKYFPFPTHHDILITKMNQFLSGSLPKRSLKDVHDEVEARKEAFKH